MFFAKLCCGVVVAFVLAAAPAAADLCKMKKDSVSGATLRAGPCDSFPALRTVTRAKEAMFFVNESFSSYECATTSTWGMIEFGARGGVGFVSTSYLEACGSGYPEDCRSVTASSLNVRPRPCASDSDPITALAQGTHVKLLGWTGDMNTACGDGKTWLRLARNGGVAYVDTAQVKNCDGGNERLTFDRTRFYEAFNATWTGLYEKLDNRPTRVEGLNYILAGVEVDSRIVDVRWFAYMLATAKLEVGNTWQPIEEYSKGAGRPYGEPVTVTDDNGTEHTNIYYGRGYVQLTWESNYRKMGNKLGNWMLYYPEIALIPTVAYQVMSSGMVDGDFTGKALDDYIPSVNSSACDYYNCRRIINGISSAQTIATYAEKFEDGLRYATIWPGEDDDGDDSSGDGSGDDDASPASALVRPICGMVAVAAVLGAGVAL